jgi:heme exporter protein C
MRMTASENSVQPLPRKIWFHLTLGLLGLTAAVFMAVILVIFYYAPVERHMGLVQKIFYFHVPSAWLSYLAFFVICVCSIAYLITKRMLFDQIAVAASEIGLLFCSLVLVTGPIWARPIWGVWWDWDARLTTTLILWLIYLGYRMLRLYADMEGERVRRYAAVIGILGAMDVPLIHYSVRWWRTLHPSPIVMTSNRLGGGLTHEMAMTLMFSLLAFTMLFILLMILRFSLEQVAHQLKIAKKADPD